MNTSTTTKTFRIHPSNTSTMVRSLSEGGTEFRALGILEAAEIQFSLVRFIEDIDRAKWRDAHGRLVQHIEVTVRSQFDGIAGSIDITARTVAWKMPDGDLWVVPTMSQSAHTGALHPQTRRTPRPWVRSATPGSRFAPNRPHRAA